MKIAGNSSVSLVHHRIIAPKKLFRGKKLQPPPPPRTSSPPPRPPRAPSKPPQPPTLTVPVPPRLGGMNCGIKPEVLKNRGRNFIGFAKVPPKRRRFLTVQIKMVEAFLASRPEITCVSQLTEHDEKELQWQIGVSPNLRSFVKKTLADFARLRVGSRVGAYAWVFDDDDATTVSAPSTLRLKRERETWEIEREQEDALFVSDVSLPVALFLSLPPSRSVAFCWEQVEERWSFQFFGKGFEQKVCWGTIERTVDLAEPRVDVRMDSIRFGENVVDEWMVILSGNNILFP